MISNLSEDVCHLDNYQNQHQHYKLSKMDVSLRESLIRQVASRFTKMFILIMLSHLMVFQACPAAVSAQQGVDFAPQATEEANYGCSDGRICRRVAGKATFEVYTGLQIASSPLKILKSLTDNRCLEECVTISCKAVSYDSEELACSLFSENEMSENSVLDIKFSTFRLLTVLELVAKNKMEPAIKYKGRMLHETLAGGSSESNCHATQDF